MPANCEQCIREPAGEAGHGAMKFRADGPYAGHRIFGCTRCGECWIRHYGSINGFAWTRLARQFAGSAPRLALQGALQSLRKDAP